MKIVKIFIRSFSYASFLIFCSPLLAMYEYRLSLDQLIANAWFIGKYNQFYSNVNDFHHIEIENERKMLIQGDRYYTFRDDSFSHVSSVSIRQILEYVNKRIMRRIITGGGLEVDI